MLKSMTGFGRCEIATEEYKISVEMKAVNHRYLDLSIKMPKKFNYFEASIRTLLKQYIQRGKVDLFITYEDYTEEKMALKYNASLAAEYMAYFEKMAEQFHIDNDIRVSDLARYPDVLMMEQVPEDVVKERFDRLLKEVQKISSEVCGRDLHTTQKVLVETLDDHKEGYVTGRLSNNTVVHFPGDESLIGKIVDVWLEESKGFYYMGKQVEGQEK